MFTVWPEQSGQRERAGSRQTALITHHRVNKNDADDDTDRLVTANQSDEIEQPLASKILSSDGANLIRAASACGQHR